MKLSKKKAWVAIALVIASFNVYAHKGATGIVKERMDSMSQMKAMADMIKGKRPFDINVVRDSADTLAGHADTLLDYFPDTDASRVSKESDALPVIWESWDRFEKLAINFETSAGTLKQATEKDLDKRSLRLVFSKTAKACSSCHDDFRRPKE